MARPEGLSEERSLHLPQWEVSVWDGEPEGDLVGPGPTCHRLVWSVEKGNVQIGGSDVKEGRGDCSF